MSKEENLRLLQEYSKTRDIETRNKILEQNYNLIPYAIKYYYSEDSRLTPTVREDMLSAGVIGLITAIERFDATKYSVLSTYAIPYIREAISHMLSEEYTFSQMERETESDDKHLSFEEQIEDTYQKSEIQEELNDAYSQLLTESERDCLDMIYRVCDEPAWSINEIAKQLGMTSKEVKDNYYRGLVKINQPWVRWYLEKLKGECQNDTN